MSEFKGSFEEESRPRPPKSRRRPPSVFWPMVLGWMRKNPSTAATPVIVLTGSQEAEAEIELMEAGADDLYYLLIC